jgi:uncharacterized protein (DUF58 family)
LEFNVTPSYAGRFELVRTTLCSGDVLGLFSCQSEFPLDFIVESLPLSLVAPARVSDASPLAVGEEPAGGKGSGQELYGVAEYLPSTDTKDILWKRVARAEDDSVPVRVREANVKASVALGVSLRYSSQEERTRTVDLALEAIAQIGRTLIAMGTTVVMTYPVGESFANASASNLAELADALIDVSTAGAVLEAAGDTAFECDLLLASRDVIPRLERAGPKSTPVLVLTEEPLPTEPSNDVFSFCGREDLSGLAMLVLGR